MNVAALAAVKARKGSGKSQGRGLSVMDVRAQARPASKKKNVK